MKDLAGERGSVLVLVLLAFAVVAVVATAFLSLAVTERTAVDNRVRSAQGYYQAEAGVRYVLRRLKQEPSWRGEGFSGLDVGIGRVAGLNFAEEITTIRLKSTGEASGLQRVVEVRLLKPLLAGTHTLLAGAAAAPGEEPGATLTLNNLTVTGDLVFDGTVEVKTNSRVKGSLLAGGHVLMTGGVVDGDVVAGKTVPVKTGIKGSVQENARVYLPDLSEISGEYLQWYREAAEAGGAVFAEEGQEEWQLGVGDLRALADGFPGGQGVVFVEGNLTIKNQEPAGPYKGRLTLAATGSIAVEGDLVREDDSCSLAVVVGQDVDIGNQTVEAVILAGGEFKATGNPTILGVISGSMVDLGGIVVLTYDSGLVEKALENIPPQVFRLVEWRKVAY